MSGSVQRRSNRRFVLDATVLVVAALVALLVAPATVWARSPWTGSLDLYRTGSFTTQRSWLWCTAADVQIIRNIAHQASDHATASQRRYFRYMRAHDRYDIPVKDGVDPAGWAAGLRHDVDGRYRLTASSSFDSALRFAVTNLRRTNLPVGITVAHGDHAWILTGFSATADPATTRDFTVTSVRVVGPLWGLQSRRYGYDMRPDTRLTPRQLRSFFTRWHYGGVRMAWEGRWVSIQPIATATATPTPSPRPTSAPTAEPTPSATVLPSATAKPMPAATPTGSPGTAPSSVVVAQVEPSMSAPPEPSPAAAAGTTTTAAVVVALAALGLLGGALWQRRRHR